jgi:hypothetical protein
MGIANSMPPLPARALGSSKNAEHLISPRAHPAHGSVIDALQYNQTLLQAMHDRLKVLGERIKPVLREAPASPRSTMGQEPPAAPVLVLISQEAATIADAIGFLEDVIDRLVL